MRTPVWVGLVAGLHVAVIASFLFIQGCGTKQVAVEPPPPPVMPPADIASAPTPVAVPRPTFQPPVAVSPMPSTVEAAGGQTYVVRNGDSLSRIASRYGVTAREIAELNNIKDANKIRIGQKIVLPAHAKEGVAPPPAPKKPAAVKPAAASVKAGPGEYIVKSGDSLSRIAARNGTTVKALREANSLKSDMIRIGQKLTIPGGATTAAAPAPAPAPVPAVPAEAAAAAPVPAAEPAPAPEPVAEAAAPAVAAAATAVTTLPDGGVPYEYPVKPGETLDDIARLFAVTKQEILTLNGLADESAVKAGLRLKIPVNSEAP